MFAKIEKNINCRDVLEIKMNFYNFYFVFLSTFTNYRSCYSRKLGCVSEIKIKILQLLFCISLNFH